jgi:putative thiamine transport system substrate-binding protein
VVANFLLSPEAQARAQDPHVLGTYTVLDLDRLTQSNHKLFTDLPHENGVMTNAELGTPLPEPHPSWMTRLVVEWERRISAG